MVGLVWNGRNAQRTVFLTHRSDVRGAHTADSVTSSLRAHTGSPVADTPARRQRQTPMEVR